MLKRARPEAVALLELPLLHLLEEARGLCPPACRCALWRPVQEASLRACGVRGAVRMHP